MSEKEIQAVHDYDLIKLLENLGLKEDFDNGKIKCTFCDEVINFDNLYSIFSDGKEIKISCNKENCKIKTLQKNV